MGVFYGFRAEMNIQKSPAFRLDFASRLAD
jgi:hypothetical protein